MSIVLITGSCGLVGSESTKFFCEKGFDVIGIDNINSYYDPSLKRARLLEIEKTVDESSGEWDFYEMALEDVDSLKKLFKEN